MSKSKKTPKEIVNISNGSMEDFIWMSYRYCIGRSTIAAAHHAETIYRVINQNPNLLSEDKKKFMAEDIRDSINNKLSFKNNIVIDGFPKHDIYTDYLCEISKYDMSKKLNANYDNISKKWFIEETTEPCESYFRNDSEYTDLVGWVKLANFLDKTSHKFVKTLYEGKEEIFETYSYPVKMSDGTYQIRYCSLDKTISFTTYIDPNYIIDVTNVV